MSLDVYLTLDHSVKTSGSGIFVRENGATVEISREEWDAKFPGREPVMVRREDDETSEAYSANITHNLGAMAEEAGIYQHLWRPEELGIAKASELIEPLAAGLALMKADPPRFERHNAPNGWGLYKHFVPFVENYLTACREYPEATVKVSR